MLTVSITAGAGRIPRASGFCAKKSPNRCGRTWDSVARRSPLQVGVVDVARLLDDELQARAGRVVVARRDRVGLVLAGLLHLLLVLRLQLTDLLLIADVRRRLEGLGQGGRVEVEADLVLSHQHA